MRKKNQKSRRWWNRIQRQNLGCIVFFGNKETSLSCHQFGSPWRIIIYTRNSLVRKSWRKAISSVEASTWRRSTCAGWWPWWKRRWLALYQLGLNFFSLLAMKRKKIIHWIKSIIHKKDNYTLTLHIAKPNYIHN